MIPSPVRSPKWALLLALLLYIVLLMVNNPKASTTGPTLNSLNDALDMELPRFLRSMPPPTQDFVTARLQNLLICDSSSKFSKQIERTFSSNATCSSYLTPFEILPDASARICEQLAGKRIAFVGPLTTYHLHNIWLNAFEEHEGRSLDCPGPEFCTFHHICFPGRNASMYMEGRKHKSPTNQELRETRSAVLQYSLSTALVSHRDQLADIYTRPIVDPLTGVRMRNYYWLRKAQKAHILVLSQGPVPAPAWSYEKLLRSARNPSVGRVLRPWRLKTFTQDLVADALNATFTSFLPALKEALQAVQTDMTQNHLMIWHGHWALDSKCTNSGLPRYIPQLAQFWAPDQDSVDPWTFYYNIQIYMQNRILPKLLPHFNVLYVPLALPTEARTFEKPPDGPDYHKDCIRERERSLEVLFFSTLFHLLELNRFSPRAGL